ncbi:hypothetical protein RYX36_022227 [Vicia faba]
MSLQITFCATVAETKVLVASPFGWYYRVCHRCPCIARGDIPPFECEVVHSTEAEIFRYKIEIEVAYARKSCNFVFWNKECELLLGVSAFQLRHTMIQARIHDALEFPLALDHMLNLEMAFKDTKANVPIPPIKTEPLQVKESVDEAKTDAPDESNVVVDVEITFEHKPGLTTPAGKRQLPGGSSESTKFEGLCDGELSSN